MPQNKTGTGKSSFIVIRRMEVPDTFWVSSTQYIDPGIPDPPNSVVNGCDLSLTVNIELWGIKGELLGYLPLHGKFGFFEA